MANTNWTHDGVEPLLEKKDNRLKFIIGGVVLIAAIGYLVFNAMAGNTQLYKTVDEFYAEKDELVGRDLRLAGWVIGDSIQYTQLDATTSILEFEIVDDMRNPGQRLRVVAMNEPKPDLLQHEAQALIEGRVGENGEFLANPGGLMLKCPTRYEEMDPALHPQAEK